MLNWFDHKLYEIKATSVLSRLFFPSSVLRDGGQAKQQLGLCVANHPFSSIP